MLSIIYIALAVILTSVLFCKVFLEEECIFVAFFASMACLLCSGLIGFVLFLFIFVNIAPKEEFRTNGSCPIYSLNSQDVVKGSFCLGSGSINSQEYYRTFLKTSRGGYERFEVSANSAEIFLSDAEPPKVSWQDVTYVYPKWFTFWKIHSQKRTKYDLTVPSNTIIQKFELK